MSPNCPFCNHPMTAHNVHQFDGPVCMWCGCGDEYVVEDQPQHVSVWREVGIVGVIALAIMGGILLTLRWMEHMVLPW